MFINGNQVLPTYSNDDFTITTTAIELLLKIPEIEAVVMFKGLLFSVELPPSLFHNNTEGQCGKLIINLLFEQQMRLFVTFTDENIKQCKFMKV